MRLRMRRFWLSRVVLLCSWLSRPLRNVLVRLSVISSMKSLVIVLV